MAATQQIRAFILGRRCGARRRSVADRRPRWPRAPGPPASGGGRRPGPSRVRQRLREAAALAGLLDADLATALAPGGHTPLASFGAWPGLMTESLKPLRAVMRAFFDALIFMGSPVAGFLPMRAPRSTLANLAKPLMATASPFATTAVMASVVARSLVSPCRPSLPVCLAMSLASARCFRRGTR